MTKTQIFPTALIVLDVCASVMCLMDGDVRRGVYWIAAAVLTTSVTF